MVKCPLVYVLRNDISYNLTCKSTQGQSVFNIDIMFILVSIIYW